MPGAASASTSWAAVPAETPETVTGAPSAATEKAPAAGRLVWSTLSSKVTVIELPSAATAALVSSGGVVSGILMLTAVPAVQEKPGLNQVLVRAVWVASAKAREVLPTTTVRALVAAVMSVSTVSVKAVAFRYKVVTE